MNKAINSAHVQVFTVDMFFYDAMIKIKHLNTVVHWVEISCEHHTMMAYERLEV